MLSECGFGCKLDDYTLIWAKLALQRGLPFEFWQFGRDANRSLHEYGAWNSMFKPLSNALDVCTEQELVTVNMTRKWKPRKMGFWIPPEFEERIKALHGDPVLYFHGVLNRYLLRLNEEHRSQFDAVRREIKKQSAGGVTVGAHVRRTDKIIEGNVYSWNK